MSNKANPFRPDDKLVLFMSMGVAGGTAFGVILNRLAMGVSLGFAAGSLAFLVRSLVHRRKR